MAFEKHLFISYAHLDNLPLSEQQQGWISRFHTALSALLSTRLGRPAQIWRDSKLQGNDAFADEIVDQFAKTAVLVSVLTPRYVESEWCTKEAREFCRTAETTGGLLVENKSRAFKIIKTPGYSETALPPDMQKELGYPFYVYRDETPIELDPSYGEDLAAKYNLAIATVAWHISKLIKSLEKQGTGTTGSAASPVPTSRTVYLAECSFDKREAREAIESDLRLHGYTVVPDRELPRDESEYLAEVDTLLGRCELSIHLVGSTYGAVPDGPSGKSVVVLQNERAMERSKSAQLPRVIWIPEGTQSASVQQKEFIASLGADAGAQRGADLITGHLETLKGAIHAALKKGEKPAPAATKLTVSERKLVYLICDERDSKATIPFRKALIAAGLEVQLPLFAGDAATVRAANQDLLTQSDGVVLFFGAGDEAWKRSVESDLRKTRADRAGKPFLATFTYLAEPVTPAKTDLIDLGEPNVINGLAGFTQAAVAPFVASLRGVAA